MKAFELIAEALDFLDNGQGLDTADATERRYSLCERMRSLLASGVKATDDQIDALECRDAKDALAAFLTLMERRAEEETQIARQQSARSMLIQADGEEHKRRAAEFRDVVNGVMQRERGAGPIGEG